MTPVLPQESAREQCLLMMEKFDSVPEFSSFLSEGCGKHFGCLICSDGTVLYAYSGYESDSLLKALSKTDYRFVPNCVKDYVDCKDYRSLHSHYEFFDFSGKKINLSSLGNVPTGTGDCCEPKLLSYCYSIGKKPSSMACFFYGKGSFEHKAFSVPCDSRCKKLLPLILGLDIVYLDSSIVVVNKPAGLLSIEGKGPDKQDCIASRVRNLYSCTSYGCIAQPCIHRLDQATSGLMVLGLIEESHRILSSDFENRRVVKEYEALVHGAFPSDVTGSCGEWVLKQRLDVDNRPMQIVDSVLGKEAVTRWERTRTVHIGNETYTRLILRPLTGRTHQLRLACSYFGHPIAGDRLYGSGNDGFDSLMLCARHLEFNHPLSTKHLVFDISIKH